MVATFNPNLSSPIDRVRQLLGDVKTAKAEVEDETISAYLSSKGEKATAAQLAYDLQAKYARLADVTVDDQLTRFSHIAKGFAELAARLAREAATEAAAAAPRRAGYVPVTVTGIGDCRGPSDDPCDCPTALGSPRYYQ